MIPANIKKLGISSSIVKHFLSAGIKHYKIHNPLPEDAQVVDIIADHRAIPIYYFIICSKEFPELNDGDEIPTIKDLNFIDLRSPDDYNATA